MHSTEIDSVSPTLRPDEGAVLTQRWADLLFVHWAVVHVDVFPLREV